MASEILPSLFLGSLDDLEDKEWMKKTGITHVLTIICSTYLKEAEEAAQGYTTKLIKAEDDKFQNLMQYFEESNLFISKALENKNKILVHCALGRSRSPTFVMAYLMSTKNMDLKEAYAFVRDKRIIMPQKAFLRQLAMYHIDNCQVLDKGYEMSKFVGDAHLPDPKDL